ncbi:T9SS type A sorting domain-containing protein [Owenweeksia hongkongensis]|uniref:T9SS type A sorting domain-containing protein n=1 Tax=Owenweeksia hongkongensis TaxID=253245 RepID=UPI003A92DE3A
MYPTKSSWQLFGCLLLGTSSLFSQWNRNAGVNPSLTRTAIVTASSENGAKVAANSIDGDENSIWESKSPLPSSFISDGNQNLLLGLQPSTSSSPSNIVKLTDGSNSGSASFAINSNGKSHVRVNLLTSTKVSLITFKANVGAAGVDVTIFEPNGDSSVIGQFTSASNYGYEKFYTTKIVAAIKLSSTESFSVTELGAVGPSLFEDLDIDLGSTQSIGWIYLRAYSSSSADSIVVFGSTNQSTWTKAVTTDNNLYFTIPYQVKPNIQARYVKVRTYMKLEDYKRAAVGEIKVFDENGIYGALPAANPAIRPLKDMIGINGIWGWGTSDYSDLATNNKTTNLYSRVGTHARNYHEMEWDVADPDITPVYTGMPGSLNKSWLDWDREYQTWKNDGLVVQTSIQFTTSWLPENLWNNPYQAAYNYGYSFASYFGPTNGNGLVTTMEVGNEPWDYDSTFYKNVLLGMAKGAKDADPAMEVFSCALQSGDPTTEETSASRNYMGVRLPENAAQYLDGLNVHHYSYISDPTTGNRVATFPENPASTMRGIVSDIRFRDANMPGKKILMSEWGWDSDGAGEPCSHNECVSEEAQAMYAARGIFMLDRLGVDRATWFFYGNLPYGSSLYTRSGLTGSKNTNFAPKKSFYTVEHILEKMGDSYFLEVISESEDAWAYLYGDSLGNPTHVVAWKPVDANSSLTTALQVNKGYQADSVWIYDGQSSIPALTSIPKNKNGEMTLNLSAAPLLIKLDSNTVGSSVSLLEKRTYSNHVSIFPNPSKGNFKIKLSLANGGNVSTRLYSLDGRTNQQLQTIDANSGNNIHEFNLNDLAPGCYIFETIQAEHSFIDRQQIIITP